MRTVLHESVLLREQGSRQPGGRPPAPGQLAVLQAFLNSHFDLVEHWGDDLLGSASDLHSWLADRGLIARSEHLSDYDAARAVTVREALRDLIASDSSPEDALGHDRQTELNSAIAGASFELCLTETGMRFVPTAAGPLDRALGVLLAAAASAMLDGSWRRLKSCPGHHCGWVFYDRSRNNSGRWCSMTVCGGREKSRAHYHRRRSHGV